jgi:hypothetical protein
LQNEDDDIVLQEADVNVISGD